MRWAFVVLAALATGCAKPPPQFEWSLPPFSAALREDNFRYVKLGATGRVDIRDRLARMPEEARIGLVNEALRQIYAQAPAGVPIALVNVVVEVSRQTTEKTDLFGATSYEHADAFLVVRADIVQFHAMGALSAPPPPAAPPVAPPVAPPAAAPILDAPPPPEASTPEPP